MELNPEQLKAVEHTEGPLLILAGAGTGKTRVITHRIAYLVQEKGVAPWNILAVTFTNKAAEEMRHRVHALLGLGKHDIWVSTFHSTCLRILRKSLPPGENQFVIYDDDDTMTLIKKCMEDLKIEDRALPPRAVYARIAAAKNELVSAEQYANGVEDFFETKVAEVYKLYQRRLHENNALDFGDLIFRTVRLFQESPDVLKRYQDLFRYILIDEYQDTNRAQYVLTKLLADKHRNLCVVGDDDQSIYRWRGADIGNILNFEEDYPGCLVIRLEQNYRSTQTILSIANQVIAKNRGRKGKNLWTGEKGGEKAVVFVGADDREEARFVVEEIVRRQKAERRKYNDFAIFYRTNAQSRGFEDELRKNRVPYTIFGGMKFYERREIKDVLAYLRVLVNPKDSVNLKRIFNVPPRGLGTKSEESLEAFASEYEIPLYEAMGRVSEVAALNSGAKKKILEFHALMEALRASLNRGGGVAQVMEKVIDDTGYREMLEAEGTVEAEGRLENLDELLNVGEEFTKANSELKLADFLDQIALAGDTDNYDPAQGMVPMMTLHLAKGLEFPVVFLVGLEEGLFPHSRSLDDPEEMEEERRLCYVGLTRARKNVFLTLAARRRLYGGEQFNLPSRFLEEMPEELLQKTETGVRFRKAEDFFHDDFATHDFDQSPQENSSYRVGLTVKHPSFGVGVVKKREGKGESEKVTVYFQNGLVKTLVVKYANLTEFE
ncbi:MAG TPA: DNA helicase PcrA [bacterium]|nr:DNA helicase PcrA [bacterium]